ncbi:hypothetical protein JKP88DRAFT_252023 [Tribonema minus]|uniref:Uncharacterized protein n=1 Tax=Tribonema minus TaxID=303371 RepID=A0A836CL98_9STRA|nr:hypothetical protein JKP88DRAFT_252023 [Tribonema minus]
MQQHAKMHSLPLQSTISGVLRRVLCYAAVADGSTLAQPRHGAAHQARVAAPARNCEADKPHECHNYNVHAHRALPNQPAQPEAAVAPRLRLHAAANDRYDREAGIEVQQWQRAEQRHSIHEQDGRGGAHKRRQRARQRAGRRRIQAVEDVHARTRALTRAKRIEQRVERRSARAPEWVESKLHRREAPKIVQKRQIGREEPSAAAAAAAAAARCRPRSNSTWLVARACHCGWRIGRGSRMRHRSALRHRECGGCGGGGGTSGAPAAEQRNAHRYEQQAQDGAEARVEGLGASLHWRHLHVRLRPSKESTSAKLHWRHLHVRLRPSKESTSAKRCAGQLVSATLSPLSVPAALLPTCPSRLHLGLHQSCVMPTRHLEPACSTSHASELALQPTR